MESTNILAILGLIAGCAYIVLAIVAFGRSRRRHAEEPETGRMILNIEDDMLVDGESTSDRMKKLAGICASLGQRVFGEDFDFTVESIARLDAAQVRYQALPNEDKGGGCAIIDSIKLMDIGTPTANLGAMTCPLASTFAAWARNAVRPAARLYLGSEVVKIETFGTYACRNVRGAGGTIAGKRSEDIAALLGHLPRSVLVHRDHMAMV